MSTVTGRAECSIQTAATLGTKPHPSVEQAKVLDTVDRIIIRPVASGRELANEAFEPIRIGFMSEIPGGSDIGLGVFVDPLILAFEDAINEGRLKRGVELLPLHVNGLPAGSEKNVKQAYLELVDAGCVLVLSIGVTDNALVLCDLVNESKVPYITMGGTTRFVGPHCFSLPNGGHGEEIAIVAAYCASQGYRKVVLTGERSPGDTEYQMFFREQARLYGIEILKEHYFDQRPTEDELDAGFRQIRELGPDALVYAGFGWNSPDQPLPRADRLGPTQGDERRDHVGSRQRSLGGCTRRLDRHRADVGRSRGPREESQLGSCARSVREAVQLPHGQHRLRVALRPGPDGR